MDIKKYTLEEIVNICKNRDDCEEGKDKENCPFLDGNCMFLTADGKGLIPNEWHIDIE